MQVNPLLMQVNPLIAALHASLVVNDASLHFKALQVVVVAVVVSSVHQPSLPLKSVQVSVFLKLMHYGNGESTHPFYVVTQVLEGWNATHAESVL